MNKICLINKGDTIEKIKYVYKYDQCSKINEDAEIGKFLLIDGRCDDPICVVENYHPFYFLKNNKENIDNLKKIGYMYIESGEYLIAHKTEGEKYVVKPMETLHDIAKKFNITKSDIIKLNCLKGDNLFVGQVLII